MLEPSDSLTGRFGTVMAEDWMITFATMLSTLLTIYVWIMFKQHLFTTIGKNTTTNEYINCFRLTHYQGYPYIDKDTGETWWGPFDRGNLTQVTCGSILWTFRFLRLL